ncbi:MAG: DUF1963 domain-containing protein [Planctomycetota bacterium]|nr:DUF1963 domain-containing protein [Planctomycetota bacterium]
MEGLRLEGEQLDNYYDLLLAMDSIQGFDENESAHRIFGHPDQIRRNVFLDCLLGRNGFLEGDREMTDEEAKQLDDEVRNLRLLLQIDSDENAGMRFGNFGTLFFTLAADDLSKKKFGNTWLVFQQPRGKAQDSDQEDVT